MPEQLYSPNERGSVLTGYLIFVGLANAWTAYRYLDILRDYIQHSDSSLQGTQGWTFPLLAILAIINVGAVVALFKWRKFGFYIFILTTIASLVINFILSIPIVLVLLGLVGIAILWLVLQPKWEYFR